METSFSHILLLFPTYNILVVYPALLQEELLWLSRQIALGLQYPSLQDDTPEMYLKQKQPEMLLGTKEKKMVFPRKIDQQRKSCLFLCLFSLL